MTDDRDKLDDETREIEEKLDEMEEQIDSSEAVETDGSGDRSSGRYPQGKRSENTPAESPNSDQSENSSQDDTDDEEPGNFISFALLGFLKLWTYFLLVPVSKLPRRTKIYQGMIKAGYQGMFKNTSANIIVNTIYKDRYIVPRPAEVDDKEGRIKTDNGEAWSMPDGLQDYRIGDASIMFGVSDAHELVDPVAARTAEKIDLDDAVYIQTPQQRHTNNFAAGPRASAAAGPQQARADGGYSGITANSLGNWNGEPIEDVLVNWRNPDEDADGMIVSLEKHYELQHSQAGSEELKKSEDRGRLAERLQDGSKKAMMYVIMLLGGIAVGMLGPAVANSLGGGEGGTSVSLMLETAGLVAGLW